MKGNLGKENQKLYKLSWQESGFFPKQNAFEYLPL